MIVRSSDAPGSPYVWRTDLLRSRSYWPTWFDGLNEKFLDPKTRKLLILAGERRLDDTMKQRLEENKHQLSNFTEAGHAVQEDEPLRMAEELFAFSAKDLGLERLHLA